MAQDGEKEEKKTTGILAVGVTVGDSGCYINNRDSGERQEK